MRVSKEQLFEIINKKFIKAGLNVIDSKNVSDMLVWADSRGVHSHGAVRVEYYVERIVKGGINKEAKMYFEKTGNATGVYHGDNGLGFTAALNAIDEAIEIAKTQGVAAVGISKMSHSGALGYFTEYAAQQDMIALSVCQSDPMAVPFGGSEPFFGTNPIAFAAPALDGKMFSLDMATTVQAWGKVLVARSKHEQIPLGWAVDKDGNDTTESKDVHALLPIAGPKGYGLMMMVDVLSGALLGVPTGKNVSSMYHDLTEGRNLGQFHLVINPEMFVGLQQFKENLSQVIDELHAVKPASGFDQVYVPGELGLKKQAEYEKDGIEIVDDIYEYLISDDLHFDRYHGKNRFSE